jgi:hypothetical protein
MRQLVAITLVLAPLIVTTGARADESAASDATAARAPCATCCCARLARLDQAHRSALALGIAFLSTGYVLAITHAATLSDVRTRYIELIPVAGPIASVSHNDLSPGWTTALMFSAWSQAMGILVLTLAVGEH